MAKIRAIAPEQFISRLRLENPWWEKAGAFNALANLPKRLYYKPFYQQAVQQKVRRALVLMGPRRVGKTVMLHQFIKELIEAGTPRRKVCYISVDAPLYNNLGLETLFSLCRQAVGDDDPTGFTIIFDEIQYLNGWEVHLKTMVDFFPQTRILVSGSAAAALRLKSNESGAGRFTDFMLPPLTFQEFLHLKDLEHLIVVEPQTKNSKTRIRSTDYAALNTCFIQYLNYCGYPEVIFNEAIQTDPGQFVRSDIIDKVLLRDLPSLYGIRDVQELNSLFNVIAYNSGNEANLENLSQQSGVDKVTIRRYLEYLEAAFLIKIVYPVGIDSRRFLRASRFKIYLTNPSMRCALFTPIAAGEEQFGQLVETAIVAQYMHHSGLSLPLQYAAWNTGEVDLIGLEKPGTPRWALEVKWSNQYFAHPRKLKSLLKYAGENSLKKATVTTISEAGQQQVDGIELDFVPAACFCYGVGMEGLE